MEELVKDFIKIGMRRQDIMDKLEAAIKKNDKDETFH